MPGVRDVTSDLAITSPQVNVEIDRDSAAALQVSANAIESAFYDAYGPHWVSTIYAAINEYKVLLELKPQISVRSERAVAAVLQSRERPAGSARHAGHAQTDVGPQAINHNGQLPAVTISFDLKPGVALGEVTTRSAPSPPKPCRTSINPLPGRGQGVRKLAREPVGAADHRHPGRLHRAGHSV